MKKTLAVLMTALSLATSGAIAGESVVAKEWAAYMETLAPLGERLAKIAPDMDDPQMRQELYRQLYSFMAHGYAQYMFSDARHPDFKSMWSLTGNWLVPNPDNVYTATAVDDDGIYKISGFRGNIRYVTLHLGGGMHTLYGYGKHGPTIADYRINDKELKVDKDGSFELLLSRTRPEGHKGNWRKLGEGTTYLLIRQSAYDWARETEWRFAIERLDTPAVKPRLTAAEIEENLKRIGPAAASWAEDWIGKDIGPVNQLVVHDLNHTSGLSTQKYWEGMFDIAPNEALVLETEMPKKCEYWNVQLGNLLWNTIDYVNRQSHLNGYLARLDKDGKFRAVISAKDPGVPNWLDVADYRKGYIFGRWADCSSNPTPMLTKVKVAEVRKYLPADTPVVTADERDASVRLRRKAAQLRRRW